MGSARQIPFLLYKYIYRSTDPIQINGSEFKWVYNLSLTMDTTKFGSSKTGRLVEISGIIRLSHAFIPNPLPPQWVWPERLWPLLMHAREELARLDGIGRHLPDPSILLKPLQNREAQRSSSLEGIVTTPEQLALFEMDPTDTSLKVNEIEAVKEVNNYARASRFQTENYESLPLSLRLIRMLHRILLKDVRGANTAPGEFRRGQVQIGKPARYVPPPASELPDCLDALEKYLHQPKPFDLLVEAFLVHYQFEAIHPFGDGNGRVGRLLLSISIKEWCNLAEQWLYMSAYFDRNKDEYMDRLFRVSTDGDWEGWIAFCLQGVIEQSIDAQRRCSRLLDLREEYHTRLLQANCPGRLIDLVDHLFVSPVETATLVKDRYKVSHPTARTDLECLVGLGILTEVQLRQRRQKGYYSKEILDITYGEL